jgi:hypothetical protein
MADIRPLELGEFVENEDGTRSTERAFSVHVDGKEMLIPSLWMSATGPVDLADDPEAAKAAALRLEAETGKRFPRFKTPDDATRFSKARSSKGGVDLGPLAK